MTKDEIKNTPELVDFMLDESVIADSRMKLHKRLEELCKLANKALDQEQKWIPVSERLPEDRRESIKRGNMNVNVMRLEVAIKEARILAGAEMERL